MIKAIVTDIEGTTSSISFVKEVLFPYARQHMADFVRQNQHNQRVKPWLLEIAQETGDDLDASIKQLLNWIDQDKKATPLKALQGLLWEEGYQQGAFKGHIYNDVVPNLKNWHKQGLKLYVYSSGSVQAQQLLFAHTDYGDLTPLFSGYFDTRIGAKQETHSYQTIVEHIGYLPAEIMFLSDIQAELDAATTAGLQTIWLVRDQVPNRQAPHLQVSDFNAIDPLLS